MKTRKKHFQLNMSSLIYQNLQIQRIFSFVLNSTNDYIDNPKNSKMISLSILFHLVRLHLNSFQKKISIAYFCVCKKMSHRMKCLLYFSIRQVHLLFPSSRNSLRSTSLRFIFDKISTQILVINMTSSSFVSTSYIIEMCDNAIPISLIDNNDLSNCHSNAMLSSTNVIIC